MMENLILIIDNWSHDELKKYLLSLEGISNVEIRNGKYLKLKFNYNPDVISAKTIKAEVYLFSKILMPCLISFTKEETDNDEAYTFTINNPCCEYCVRGDVEDLIEINGITKAKAHYNKNKSLIDVMYDSKVISKKELDALEEKFNS